MNQTQVGIIGTEINDGMKSGNIEKAVIDRLTFPCRVARLSPCAAYRNSSATSLRNQPPFSRTRQTGIWLLNRKKTVIYRLSSRENTLPAKNASVQKELRHRKPKQSKIKIVSKDICFVAKKELPEDAIFKGYKDIVNQDIIIKTENVKFKVKYMTNHHKRNIITDSYRWKSSAWGNSARAYVRWYQY